MNRTAPSCKFCPDKSCAVTVLSDAELEALSGNVRHVAFDKGELIFREGVLNSHVFYLKKGLIKLHQTVHEDKEAILKICTPHCYLGLSTIFGDRINQYSATAIEDTEICVIDIATFKNLIYQNGRFGYEIIADVCKDQLTSYRRHVDLTRKQTNGRLAGVLLFFANNVYQSPTFELPLTRMELGEFLGISREGVTRGLTQFKEDGLIDVDKNTITLLQPDRLHSVFLNG